MYSGWHPSTILIVALTAAIAALVTLMVIGVYMMRIHQIETQEIMIKKYLTTKLRILRTYFLIITAVIIISIIYETSFNRTIPRVVSDFFIASWILIGASLPFALYGLIKIFADNRETWIPSGIALAVCSIFFMWWICCQIVGIVLEPYWSLNFFASFFIVVGCCLCALSNFTYQYDIIKRYSDERSYRWITIQKNFWFLQWHLVELFIIFLVVILVLEIRVLHECFSMIQHASLGLSLLQSLLVILIGVITLGSVLRYVILPGLDKNRCISPAMTSEILRLHEQKQIEKHSDWTSFSPATLMPISIIFPSPRRSLNLLIPSDWTLENLRNEGPLYFQDISFDGFSFLYNDIVISRGMEKIFLIKKLKNGKLFLTQDKQRLDEQYIHIGTDAVYRDNPSLLSTRVDNAVDENCPLIPTRDIE